MSKSLKKIIVLLGPTASGKTGLGVKLAHEFDGEIVSADSRQVYRGMDIGTGKDLKEYSFKYKNKKIKIPYYLIDVVNPKTEFNLAKHQKLAYKAIDNISRRDKLPIVVGGTGLYLQALVDGYSLSSVKTDKKLRAKLEKMSVAKLFSLFKKLDSQKASKLNQSDKNNKRRLIRYIELEKNGGEKRVSQPRYNSLVLGLTWPIGELRKRIGKRLGQRLAEGMVKEVEGLRRQGVSWKRLEGFGLEYRFISLYLQNKIGYQEMIEKLNKAIGQFAKRQMSWFRRWERQGAKIIWLKNKKQAKQEIKKFL